MNKNSIDIKLNKLEIQLNKIEKIVQQVGTNFAININEELQKIKILQLGCKQPGVLTAWGVK